KREKSGKDSRNAAEDLQDTIQDIKEYPEVLAFDLEHGGKLKSALAEQDSRLKVSAIQFSEKDQDFKAAAKLYEKFAEESQDNETVSKAFENAVASWLRAGDMDSANRVVLSWQTRQPNNKAAAQAIRNSATLLFIQGQFDASADMLQRLGLTTKDSDAFELSIRIVSSLGNSEKLSSLVGKFLQVFPQSPHRSRILADLALHQERQKMDALAAQTYKQCLAISGSEDEAECALRLGLLYSRLGNLEESRVYLKKAAQLSAKGAGAFFSAWAKLQIARERDSELTFPKLTVEGLAKDLPRRLQSFEGVQKAYASVLESGGGFSVSASLRLGSVALELANE
ncbi:hypothetical protein EBZ37_15360, partial [bacterium]|nr:hypothetical protein [bacterium]